MIEYENEPDEGEEVLTMTAAEASALELAEDTTIVYKQTVLYSQEARTDSILYSISNTKLEDGLIITGATPVMTQYVWGGNALNPAGSFIAPGSDMSAATVTADMIDPDVNMLDNFEAGAVGIYVERFDGNLQYPSTFQTNMDTGAADLGKITLYTPMAADSPSIIPEAEPDSDMKLSSLVAYSTDEIVGLEAKYGTLPTGVNANQKIREIFYNLGTEAVSTFTARAPASHKIHNYTKLNYTDLITIEDLESAEQINITGGAVTDTQERVRPSGAPIATSLTSYT